MAKKIAKNGKQKCTFTISPHIFVKLNIYSAQKGLPYSRIIEALIDTYIEDPIAFPSINFDKYK